MSAHCYPSAVNLKRHHRAEICASGLALAGLFGSPSWRAGELPKLRQVNAEARSLRLVRYSNGYRGAAAAGALHLRVNTLTGKSYLGINSVNMWVSRKLQKHSDRVGYPPSPMPMPSTQL